MMIAMTVMKDGSKIWHKRGDAHREDGPAIEWADGHVSWYLNNHKLNFEEWLQLVNITPEEKTLLMLKYG